MQSHAQGQVVVSNARVLLPPTPPLRPGSGFDSSNQSPSAASSHSSNSASNYYSGGAFNNLEPHQQRQISHAPLPQKRPSIHSQGLHSPFTGSPYASPGTASTSSFVSPIDPPVSSAMYYQRALPGSFPTTTVPVSITPSTYQVISHGNPAWQHHHFFPPSSSVSYPPSQDRYICQTCTKAFSRPSSLRIHSHSHTGEKPFKCPHAGCGKAFSVRSNMKRHERGCHSGRGDSPGSV